VSTVEHDILRDAADAVMAARIATRARFDRDETAIEPGECIVWMDQVEYEPQSGRSAVIAANIAIEWMPRGPWSELDYHTQLAALDAEIMGVLGEYGAAPLMARVLRADNGGYLVLREYRILYHRDMLSVDGVIRTEV
jgi:hypothetical protein